MNKYSNAILLGACLVSAARACDSCAIAIASGEGRAGFLTSVSEQFTHLGTLRLDGDKVANDTGQFLDSSITHLNVGYRDGARCTYQLTLPYVHRSFQRPEGDLIERGTESGLGDATLVAHHAFARGADANGS